MKAINPADLICMDDFSDEYGYRVDLAYACADNALFRERIYKKDAKLWLHRDLAGIVFRAAQTCAQHYKIRFVLYDGLRTVDTQLAMMETQRVKDNPHWLEPPRLLSPAGGGGHPRGMAIDIGLETFEGTLIDMGTDFDYLAEASDPIRNPAHRLHLHSPEIQANRAILDTCMTDAANYYKTAILPLPEEWWDYRLMPEYYNLYAPLWDKDLPEAIKLNRKRE